MLNVLDLFSGIGGFSLGLKRAGMRTVAFCEIDPYCRAVLAKHWPDVPVFGDVRELTAASLAKTLADARHDKPKKRQSHDRVNEQRPAQRGREQQSSGVRTSRRIVIGDIAKGIDISGAIIAENTGIDVICGGFPCQDISLAGKGAGLAGARSGLWKEYARIIGEVRPRYVIVENVAALLGRGLGDVLGDLAALGYHAEWHCIPASAVGAPHRRDRIWIVAHPAGEGWRPPWPAVAGEWGRTSNGSWWLVEPDVGRVANGVPARVDRLRAIGNAVVPQIPEIIGRAIMNMDRT